MRPTPVSSVNSTLSSSALPDPHNREAVEDLLAPARAARAALALIRVYKLVVSPWFPGACRFVPSCADYTAEAIARYGLVRGVLLGVRRLSRCHPFGGHGHDPVPVPRSGLTSPTSLRSH